MPSLQPPLLPHDRRGTHSEEGAKLVFALRRQSQAAEAAATSSKAGLRRLNQAAQAAFAIRCRGFTRRASDFDGALILQVNHDCAILLMRTTATFRQSSGLIWMFAPPRIAASIGENYERSSALRRCKELRDAWDEASPTERAKSEGM
jgi:hypothetical protein